ncbi:MAG: DUF6565 domain-containing protein [Bacteroidota bacterium]
MKRNGWVLVIILLLAVACAPVSKKQFIAEHEHFVAQVATDYENYDEDDWEEKNERMKEYWEEVYPEFEDEMSLEEKTELTADAVRYYLYQYRDQTLHMIDQADERHLEILKENMQIATEAGVDFVDEMLPYFEEMLPEFEALARKLEKQFNSKDFQRQLEKSLNKLKDRIEEMEDIEIEVED